MLSFNFNSTKCGTKAPGNKITETQRKKQLTKNTFYNISRDTCSNIRMFKLAKKKQASLSTETAAVIT